MQAVTGAIIQENGKYLICQRAADDDCGSLWEFPGGKCEIGESLEECIIREIKEELDLDIEVSSVFAKKSYKRNGKKLEFTFFVCNILSGEMKMLVHDDYAWVEASEFGNYDFLPADIEILEMISN